MWGYRVSIACEVVEHWNIERIINGYILAEKWVLGDIDRLKMMIIDHCSGN